MTNASVGKSNMQDMKRVLIPKKRRRVLLASLPQSSRPLPTGPPRNPRSNPRHPSARAFRAALSALWALTEPTLKLSSCPVDARRSVDLYFNLKRCNQIKIIPLSQTSLPSHLPRPSATARLMCLCDCAPTTKSQKLALLSPISFLQICCCFRARTRQAFGQERSGPFVATRYVSEQGKNSTRLILVILTNHQPVLARGVQGRVKDPSIERQITAMK